MISEILATAKKAEYDFRRTANPDDPLRHLFAEWASYYRMKWAIAKVLQPQSILEIGVRFGYSAATFLDACPECKYLGIDNDSETSGGHKGAMNYARSITTGNARYLLGDSQTMDEFPGGKYDLIHVDGQQDGDGSFRDLTKAIRQGRYVLVDGYFWTRDNFLNVSEFLHRHRDLIESYFVIPGYAGELLITPKPDVALPVGCTSSETLRYAYTSDYYLLDCGGCDSFKRDRGAGLSDQRLRAVGSLAEIVPPGRALDLGCGRGELTAFLARLGHEVLAVDYSPQAIELAREAVDAAQVNDRVEFYCGDAKEVPLRDKYDVAVASDLIEHMSPQELDRLYGRLAEHMAADGLFIVHTYPNEWYYRFDYARKLRQARRLGAYLPGNPRSRYEQLMHINEQSPAVLRKQLQKNFAHVTLWFATHELSEPFANLKRKFSREEMRAAGDLFAVASHTPFDIAALVSDMEMQPVPRPLRIQLNVLEVPKSAAAGARFAAKVSVHNQSDTTLTSWQPRPIHLCYHWFNEAGETVVFDGLRTVLPKTSPGAEQVVVMQVEAPWQPGKYLLRLTMVQELVCWFDGAPQSTFREVLVDVGAY